MNNPQGIIIFGSSRSKGDSFQIGKRIAEGTNLKLVDLNTLDISVYDYDHANQTDDFLPLAEEMAMKRLIVLLSPVYWYTMSAQMKTFLDRWSDLVTIRKDIGRQLKGVNLISISCSSDEAIGEEFILPFSKTADYMEMKFAGHFHTWINDDGSISPEVEESIAQAIIRINSLLVH